MPFLLPAGTLMLAFGAPGAMRMLDVMSDALMPAGGTMKSVEAVPVPTEVITVRAPEAAEAGTVKVRVEGSETVVVAVTPLIFTVVAPAAVSKLLPFTVTVVVTAPIVGEKLEIVGAPGTVTVNG